MVKTVGKCSASKLNILSVCLRGDIPLFQRCSNCGKFYVQHRGTALLDSKKTLEARSLEAKVINTVNVCSKWPFAPQAWGCWPGTWRARLLCRAATGTQSCQSPSGSLQRPLCSLPPPRRVLAESTPHMCATVTLIGKSLRHKT